MCCYTQANPPLAVGDVTPSLPQALLQAACPQAGPPCSKHPAPWGQAPWTARLMETAGVLRSLWKSDSSRAL